MPRVPLRSVVAAMLITSPAVPAVQGGASLGPAPAGSVRAVANPVPDGIVASGGKFHTLVLGADGMVYGAGANDDGQLTRRSDRNPALGLLTGLPVGVGAAGLSPGISIRLCWATTDACT